MFWNKIRTIGILLRTPVFFYMKVGFKGYTFHGHVLPFVPVNSYGHTETLPSFYGTSTKLWNDLMCVKCAQNIIIEHYQCNH